MAKGCWRGRAQRFMEAAKAEMKMVEDVKERERWRQIIHCGDY